MHFYNGKRLLLATFKNVYLFFILENIQPCVLVCSADVFGRCWLEVKNTTVQNRCHRFRYLAVLLINHLKQLFAFFTAHSFNLWGMKCQMWRTIHWGHASNLLFYGSFLSAKISYQGQPDLTVLCLIYRLLWHWRLIVNQNFSISIFLYQRMW